MTRCSFCGRTFKSSQSVRAHLKTCPNYLRYKQRPQQSAPPRAQRALTDEEQLRRLFETAPSYSRRPTASTAPEPRAATPRPNPRPDNSGAHEQRALEARREREAREDAQRRQVAEQRAREETRRQLIQHIKGLVVDLYVTWEPIPAAARADAKVAIERVFAQLPILELPQHELQQIATAVRERVYTLYRPALAPPTIATPPPRDVTPTPVHNPPQEVTIMPMHRMFSGDFFCPRCDAEYELDRTPEKDAVCPDCGVPLEEFEEDEGDSDAD